MARRAYLQRWWILDDTAAEPYVSKVAGEPVIRAYIAARWTKLGLDLDVDDACQDVFVECFRANGPIYRADRTAPSGFRAFLYGVVRNVARRIEEYAFHEPHHLCWLQMPGGRVRLLEG